MLVLLVHDTTIQYWQKKHKEYTPSDPDDDSDTEATSESPNFRDANTGGDEDEIARDVNEVEGSTPSVD